METEFFEFNFHVLSMFHPPDGHVGTELEIEPTRLDFRKWSPALHMLPWVPAGDLFPLCPSHYISDIEHSTPCTLLLLSVHSILSECTLNALHYTHLTQHFRYTILYLLVFFVKKKLEHIRKCYVL